MVQQNDQYDQPATTPAAEEIQEQIQQVQVQLAPDQIDQLLCQEKVTIQLQPQTIIPRITKEKITTPTLIPGSQWTVTSTSSPTKPKEVSPKKSSRRKPKLQPRPEPEDEPSSKVEYPDAPVRPPKPFRLYLKSEMAKHETKSEIDQHASYEKCRSDWNEMEISEKGKWIQLASEEYSRYEEHMSVYMRDNPDFVPPPRKSILTVEEKKILDKYMGRPEMPSASAYSLFTKIMLNGPEMKQYPKRDQMRQIGIRFKMLGQAQKDLYQKEVNDSMAKYRAEYDVWFDRLNDKQKAEERERGSRARDKNNKKFIPAS